MRTPEIEESLTVAADNSGINRHVWPTAETVRYVFPGNERTAGPTLKVTWLDGGLRRHALQGYADGGLAAPVFTSSERLLAVVNNLLDLARLEQGWRQLDTRAESPTRTAASSVPWRSCRGGEFAGPAPEKCGPHRSYRRGRFAPIRGAST